MKINILVVFAAALALTACVSVPSTPYDRSATTIQTVGLPGHIMPPTATAAEIASVGSNFGLVGALVDASIQSSRQEALNKALANDHYDAEGHFRDHLLSALQVDGYGLKIVDAGPRDERKYFTVYPAASVTGVDAYLDVVVTDYGVLSSGAFAAFRPVFAAKVRLVSAKDPTKVLMENWIIYNPLAQISGVISIPPNPAYSFKNRAEMLADTKKVEAGIDDAEKQVADTIGRLLK